MGQGRSLFPSKGRHAREAAQRPERIAGATGAEVRKRERPWRLVLFRDPGLEESQFGGVGRSLECSHLVDSTQAANSSKGHTT